jgi:hypothetical protein
MVTKATEPAESGLASPLFAICALISLIPLPLSKFFTGSLLSLVLMFFMSREMRLDLPMKLSRRFLWVSFSASGFALMSVFFQVGGSEGLDLDNYEVVFFPTSLAISIYVLVKVSRALGAKLTMVLAAGPLLIVDYLQRGYQGNFWKYAVGITVTLLILYLLKGSSKMIWFSVFAALCTVSLVLDTRSIFLLLALALVVSFFLQRFARTNTIWKNLVAIGFSGTTYLLFFNLAISGWFGDTVMRLTLEQSGGNPLVLLFGARPEVQGNINLIASDPIRIIPGEPLSSDQIAMIRNSFSFSNRDPFSAYVNNNILGFEEFHSIFTNLWFHLGVAGVVYGLLLTVIAIRIAIVAHRARVDQPPISFDIERVLLTYLALRIFWDLAFSPLSDMRAWPLYAIAFLSLAKKEQDDKS